MPFDSAPDSRQWSGLANYHDGLAAEDSVVLHYERRGSRICARRWRGKSGEIDLVVREGDTFVVVEVKKGRTHGDAARHLSHRQLSRICRAADEYLGAMGHGLSCSVRIDLATVDRAGEIDIMENISLF